MEVWYSNNYPELYCPLSPLYGLRSLEAHSCIVIVIFFLKFSCNPGWIWNCFVAKVRLQFLNSFLQPAKYWDYRNVSKHPAMSSKFYSEFGAFLPFIFTPLGCGSMSECQVENFALFSFKSWCLPLLPECKWSSTINICLMLG